MVNLLCRLCFPGLEKVRVVSHQSLQRPAMNDEEMTTRSGVEMCWVRGNLCGASTRNPPQNDSKLITLNRWRNVKNMSKKEVSRSIRQGQASCTARSADGPSGAFDTTRNLSPHGIWEQWKHIQKISDARYNQNSELWLWDHEQVNNRFKKTSRQPWSFQLLFLWIREDHKFWRKGLATSHYDRSFVFTAGLSCVRRQMRSANNTNIGPTFKLDQTWTFTGFHRSSKMDNDGTDGVVEPMRSPASVCSGSMLFFQRLQSITRPIGEMPMSGQTPVCKQGSWKCKLQFHKNKCKTPSKHKPAISSKPQIRFKFATAKTNILHILHPKRAPAQWAFSGCLHVLYLSQFRWSGAPKDSAARCISTRLAPHVEALTDLPQPAWNMWIFWSDASARRWSLWENWLKTHKSQDIFQHSQGNLSPY